MIKNVKNKLINMDNEIKSIKEKNTEWKMKSNLYQYLSKNLLDLISKYQQIQLLHKSRCREKVERHLRITKPNLTQENIDKLINEEDIDLLKDTILLDKRHEKAIDSLEYIERRHRDFIKLSNSVAELYELFQELSILTDFQNDLIDNIQHNVSDTVAYVKKGNDELKKAREYSTKSRKKMCFILITILIMFIVLIAISLGLLKNFNIIK
jgi:t-SNARE complex subunit (syntaxin)